MRKRKKTQNSETMIYGYIKLFPETKFKFPFRYKNTHTKKRETNVLKLTIWQKKKKKISINAIPCLFLSFYQGESNDPPLQKQKTRKLRKVKNKIKITSREWTNPVQAKV